MIRNLWAFLVGDWHRSDVRRTLWRASAATVFFLASMAIAVPMVPFMGAGALACGMAVSILVGGVLWLLWDNWLSSEIRRSAQRGRNIIRTREQSRRERGQLSVRDQGGELSGVE